MCDLTVSTWPGTQMCLWHKANKRILALPDIRTQFCPTTTLRRLLVHVKDLVSWRLMTDVVYQIGCQDCPATNKGTNKKITSERAQVWFDCPSKYLSWKVCYCRTCNWHDINPQSILERVRISWNSVEASRQCCLCSLSSAPLPGVQVA